jgi:hypothetical protein
VRFLVDFSHVEKVSSSVDRSNKLVRFLREFDRVMNEKRVEHGESNSEDTGHNKQQLVISRTL